MAELLDDLAARSYLAPLAAVVAVLALGVALVLCSRVSALSRRVRGLGEDRPAGRAFAARHVTSSPHGAPSGADDEPGFAAPAPGAPVPDPGPAPTAEAEPAARAGGGGPPAGPDTSAEPAGEQAIAVAAALREVVLLGRQVELLDGLEQRERDPEVLAALFQLDNLTMRLRRNAETVLVLAGRQTRRRVREPLSVADVVRTACSQVEDYPRVDVTASADPVLQAASVVPVAHLLAEVLENATRFSAPGTRVRADVTADDDGAVVTITDAGIGMDASALADARRRLAGGTTAEDAGQRLGLLAAGRIARRLELGTGVASDPGGTTVTVRLPARLLVAAPALAAPEEDRTAPPPSASVPEPTRLPDLTPSPPSPPPSGGPSTHWPVLSEAEVLAAPRPGTAAVPWRALPGPAESPLASLTPLDPGAAAGAGFVPVAVSSAEPPAELPRRPGPYRPALPVGEPVGTPDLPGGPAAGADGWFQPGGQGLGTGPATGATHRDEAFAELGRLSGYTPTRAEGASGATPLVRREPGAVAEPLGTNRGPEDRDASEVKRRFTAFHSGRGRARRR